MTRTIARAGNCGFTTMIRAEKTSDFKVKVNVESDCKTVSALSESLTFISLADIFPPTQKHLAIGAKLKHPSCPFPAALAMVVEAELGMALPGKTEISSERES